MALICDACVCTDVVENWRLSELYGVEAKQAFVGALCQTLSALRQHSTTTHNTPQQHTRQIQQAKGQRGGGGDTRLDWPQAATAPWYTTRTEALTDAMNMGSLYGYCVAAEAQVLLCLRTCLRERSGAEATATTPQVRPSTIELI